ncbi:uncharacterized protein LOC122861162 [Aphidius gifuensis]|uniref:uncharacterized protein LOC122861162 n=1 Tax=Aphidius gifuensis TaxID=684658 RepID=UPI001CDC2DB9|nr:uncharacterized protein LOC122861162 [Aphidius gifuensis]
MQLRVIRSFALLKIINLKTVGNPLYTAEHTRTTYMNLKNLAKPYKKHFFHNSQQKCFVSERLVKKVAKIALCAGGIMWMTGVIHAPVKGPIHASNPVPESPQVATSSPGIRLYVHLDMNPNNTTSLSKPTSDDETTVAPLGIDPPKVMDPESSPSSIDIQSNEGVDILPDN